jgi:hypothetical protein
MEAGILREGVAGLQKQFTASAFRIRGIPLEENFLDLRTTAPPGAGM